MKIKDHYDAGLDILGHRGRPGPRRHHHHHGPRGGGFRRWGGGPRYWGPGWGWPSYYEPGGDTYIVNFVDEDEDEDAEIEEILGDDVLGLIDSPARKKELDNVRRPTVSIARIMARYAQQMIDRALAMARSKPGLAMSEVAWQKVKAQAAGYQTDLTRYASTPNEIYPNGGDLKDCVMRAFIAADNADGHSGYADAIWGGMWAEITHAMMVMPPEAIEKMNEVLPSWAKWSIGIGGATAALVIGTTVFSKMRGR